MLAIVDTVTAMVRLPYCLWLHIVVDGITTETDEVKTDGSRKYLLIVSNHFTWSGRNHRMTFEQQREMIKDE